MQILQDLVFIFLVGCTLSLLSIKPLESGHTPLQQAIMSGNLKEVRHLVMSGIDVNEIDGYGRTAVHFASQENNLEALNLLYEAGAHIDTESLLGDTPLTSAVVYGHPHIVEKLVELGANVHIVDIAGYNLLHIAARKGHDEIITILLHAGVDWKAKNIHGFTPLDEANFGDFFSYKRVGAASILKKWSQDPISRFLYWLKNHALISGAVGLSAVFVGYLMYYRHR